MEASLVTMSPLWAEFLLRNNPNNRPVKKRHLEFLCQQIRSGQWKFNGDAVRVCKDGSLLDGQHRLMAVVQTGISIDTLLVVGMDQEVFRTIDTGAVRTAADTLAVAGETNCRNLAAAVIVAHDLMSGKTDFSRARKVSNEDIFLLVSRNPEIKQSMRWAKPLYRLAPASIVVALHYIFSRRSPIKADAFFNSVATGEKLGRYDPEYLLRQRLIDNATAKGKVSRRYIAALFIKAWNASMDNVQIKSLAFRESGESAEQFPAIRRT